MEEINDLITLLRKLIGLPTSSIFEEYMWYFMEEILRGEEKFHWVKLISDNIHNQIFLVKKTKEFYMTSYLVYLLAIKFPCKGLNFVRKFGTKKGKKPMYKYYP